MPIAPNALPDWARWTQHLPSDRARAKFPELREPKISQICHEYARVNATLLVNLQDAAGI